MERLLRRRAVETMVGLKKTALYEMMKRGEFPRPVRLGGLGARPVGWLESEVQAWISARVAESRKVPDAALNPGGRAPQGTPDGAGRAQDTAGRDTLGATK